MLIIQMFWVCELTHTGWKQIPGAICLVPPVVPISLVVSTSPAFLASFVCSLINPVFSDTCFGCHVSRCSLDGMARFLPSVYAVFHEKIQIARGVHIRALRFRLFSIFSMSIATTVASLVHAIMVLVNPGIWEAIFGNATSSPSFISLTPVCTF